MSFYGTDFKHYMDIEVKKEDRPNERMAIVTHVKIKAIRMDDIVEYIYENLDPRNNLREPTVKVAFEALPLETKKSLATSMFIYRYCIHRILTHFRVYQDESWQYHLTDDYYSQDVSSITLKPHIAEEIDRCLRQMVTLKDNRKIESILELEFGRVLPEIQNKEWRIAQVPADSLRFTNQALYNKCADEDLTYLDSYKLPRGLCIAEPTATYRVIDGYHRLAAVIKSGSNPSTKCLVIYC